MQAAVRVLVWAAHEDHIGRAHEWGMAAVEAIDVRIGQNIRSLREQLNLTIDDVSILVSCTSARLTEYERGGAKAPARLLLSLSDAFRVNVSDFFAGLWPAIGVDEGAKPAASSNVGPADADDDYFGTAIELTRSLRSPAKLKQLVAFLRDLREAP